MKCKELLYASDHLSSRELKFQSEMKERPPLLSHHVGAGLIFEQTDMSVK